MKSKSIKELEKKIDNKSKRVHFHWLRSYNGCKAKAHIAYIADQYSLKDITNKKQFFYKTILPKVNAKIPKLFNIVRKHYRKKGRTLDRDQFNVLLYERFICMYETKTMKPNSEHPSKTDKQQLIKAYNKFIDS